jgi:predicted ATP-binding protein involved in virulence
MAKKMLIAKSHNTGHRHSEPKSKVKVKFDKNGYFRTSDPEQIAVLEKYNGKYWDIIDEKDLEKEEEERRLREMGEQEIQKKVAYLKKLEADIKAAEKELAELEADIKAAEKSAPTKAAPKKK